MNMTLTAKAKPQTADFLTEINKHLNLSHYLYLQLNLNNTTAVKISIKESNREGSPEDQKILQQISKKENFEIIQSQHDFLSLKHFTPCAILEDSSYKAFIAKTQHKKVALFIYRSSIGILDNVQENFLRLNLDINPRLFNSIN